MVDFRSVLLIFKAPDGRHTSGVQVVLLDQLLYLINIL